MDPGYTKCLSVTVECSFCAFNMLNAGQLSNDRRIKITVYSFAIYFIFFQYLFQCNNYCISLFLRFVNKIGKNGI